MADVVKNSRSPIKMVAGVLGALLGYAIGQYAWTSLLIPGLTAVLVGVILAKFVVSKDRKPFVGAIAVQAGQLAWFIAGALLTGMWAPVALDVVVLVTGLLWLIVSPGLIAVLICGIYQLLGLTVNGISIAHADFGSSIHRALVVHIAMRVLAIVLLSTAIVTQRRRKAERTGQEPLINVAQPPAAPIDQ